MNAREIGGRRRWNGAHERGARMNGYWGKIAVGLRVCKAMDGKSLISWTRFLTSSLEVGDVILLPAVDYPHAQACNMLTNQFLTTNCDSILFVDDDMRYAPDVLPRMRRIGRDYDMLAALTVCRRPPFAPPASVMVSEEEGKRIAAAGEGIAHKATQGHYITETAKLRDTRGDVMAVDFVGLAFTIIRRCVIERVIMKKGSDVVFEFRDGLGEDGNFCEDARSVGCKIGVTRNISVYHRVECSASWDVEGMQTVMIWNPYGVPQPNEEVSNAVVDDPEKAMAVI